MADDEEDEIGVSSVDRTTGLSPVFDVRDSGADAASDVHFGGALAGSIFEDGVIESRETVYFVNIKKPTFGVSMVSSSRTAIRCE